MLRHLSSAAEQRFCKAWVLGSNPRGGSSFVEKDTERNGFLASKKIFQIV